MKKLRNIHPGEILIEEFLVPLGISANSAKFWLGLQDDFDIEAENKKQKQSLNSIKLYSAE